MNGKRCKKLRALARKLCDPKITEPSVKVWTKRVRGKVLNTETLVWPPKSYRGLYKRLKSAFKTNETEGLLRLARTLKEVSP